MSGEMEAPYVYEDLEGEESQSQNKTAEKKPRKRWLVPVSVVAVGLFGIVCFGAGFAVAYFAVPCAGSESHIQLEEQMTTTRVPTSDNIIIGCTSYQDQLVQDCSDVLMRNPTASSGIYGICSSWQYHRVHCDMETENGAWTTVQLRQDGRVDFYRTYEEYAAGFGEPSGELWIGNRVLHTLTLCRTYSLRIDMEDFEGNTRYALYNNFAVGPESDGFNVTITGYSGTAGDSITTITKADHNGQRFSARDRDQDSAMYTHCAQKYGGAWWFESCFSSHLNGRYVDGGQTPWAMGIIWQNWKGMTYSLKRTEMKIRPTLWVAS